MKNLQLLLLSLLSLSCYAQDLTVIDTIKLKCSYEYKYLRDTTDINKTYSSPDLLHLQIGSKCSKCFSYRTYQTDSIKAYGNLHETYKRILKEADSKGWNTEQLTAVLPHKKMCTKVYKNYPDSKTTVTESILLEFFQYEEDTNLQEWDLSSDSTKTIMGYECQMATCKFRGREWTAWFALDIPISDGPWKLSGLPGLIMEAYDRGNQQYFCINGMQKVNAEPISYGIIGIDPKRIEHTTHRAFLKARYATLRNDGNPLAESIGLQLSPRKNPPRFDWIEREEKYW